jgi:hypothetical protein
MVNRDVGSGLGIRVDEVNGAARREHSSGLLLGSEETKLGSSEGREIESWVERTKSGLV